ncbi:hypothetical protein ACTMU2_36605 [Cupriavidus basilensis]
MKDCNAQAARQERR